MESRTPRAYERTTLPQMYISRTCPHFVILGAVGGARQIGQDVNPSSWDMVSPLAAALAIAEVRGIIIWRMSCHWKKLRSHQCLPISKHLSRTCRDPQSGLCNLRSGSLRSDTGRSQTLFCVSWISRGDQALTTNFPYSKPDEKYSCAPSGPYWAYAASEED